MAYIPQNWGFLRQKYLGEAPGATGAGPVPGATGGAAPAGGSAAPAPVGTGRFAALRGYFEANQPTADAQAADIAKGVEEKAQAAQAKTTEAAATPENFGGLELSGEAEADRQEALEGVKAAGSQAGVEGLIGKGRGADYTPGMRSADAYLYGRAEPLQKLSGWESVLSALNPTPGETLKKPEYDPNWQPPVGEDPGVGGLVDFNRRKAEYDAWVKKYEERKKAQG